MDVLIGVLVAVVVVAVAARWAWGRLVERVTDFEFERGLRYDRGRFAGVVGPGRYTLLRSRASIVKVDVRPRVVVVPGQEVITADGSRFASA